MRKSFAMDSRGKDFNLDPEHAQAIDAARRSDGQEGREHRGLAGDPAGPAVPRGVPPERAASA
jgi:hypothetical protein